MTNNLDLDRYENKCVQAVVFPTASISSRKAQNDYQQALDDFGITQLLEKLSSYFDADFNSAEMELKQQELESLAVTFIQQLSQSITDTQIASYLHAIRHNYQDILPNVINRKFQRRSIELPANFPDTAKTPRFLYGDRLRWISESSQTDCGTVIGRFYSFASHRCCWMWCYLIWLSKDSSSATWTVVDTAWEEDLEPLDESPNIASTSSRVELTKL